MFRIYLTNVATLGYRPFQTALRFSVKARCTSPERLSSLLPTFVPISSASGPFWQMRSALLSPRQNYQFNVEGEPVYITHRCANMGMLP